MSVDRYKIDNQESVYFLTFTVVGWLDVITRIEYKEATVAYSKWIFNDRFVS